ncbi:MarR family winged helix-turn-helix transcriptional regulator [Corynebacterium suicordis]|uniref:MarR family transcriptional regulator n=1 Tax=Corynebacterium suicordis DSM 45110 TaxID=1121369 RepID=A0ABR9ZGR5_9CORY|nr:MarR family transcriptional regulator [Corynebacterium suicordis]MBF4552590.1 MarR family transcriptional regulator [Corynebacterium suicordis DSM 45110]MDR6278452.1 DNA-binding MarR family transcriptional regulator [Corynebacterium suicordis]
MSKTPLEIAQQLRPALSRLYLLYFRQAEAFSISQAQMSIMTILEEHGPMRISQIAHAEAIRMPTASNAVNQLESMGLVSRVRDVSDRRGVSVQLTDKGADELQSIGDNRNRALARMIANLSPEEVQKVEEAAPIIEMILNRYTEAQTKD